MVEVTLYVMAALSFASLIYTLQVASKYSINGPAFMAQIRKLVVANNIDRAIKLCNTVPNALISQATKEMLLHANQPHKLELVYDQCIAEINLFGNIGPIPAKRLRLLGLVEIAGLILVMALFSFKGDGGEGVALGVFVLFWLLTNVSSGVAMQIPDKAKLFLPELRMLLYSRVGYIPPFIRPVERKDASPQKIQDWKDYIRSFEDSVHRRRSAGENVDTQEAFDKFTEDRPHPPL